MTVLEVFKPTPQGWVKTLDDLRQAPARVTLGLGTNRIFELCQAFLAGVAGAALKGVAQKVKAVGRCVYNPRLGGV